MFSNGTSFVDHLRRQPLISACFVAMTVTAVAGLVWACPVCPGQVAFGFHKKVFWVVGVVLPAVLLACTAFSKTDLTTFRRLAGGGLALGLFPMAWLFMHQAVTGICPFCLTWWALYSVALVANLWPLPNLPERVTVAALLVCMVGFVFGTVNLRTRAHMAKLVFAAEALVREVGFAEISPAGLAVGTRAPVALLRSDSKDSEYIVVSDCGSCSLELVKSFLNHVRPTLGKTTVILVHYRDHARLVQELDGKIPILSIDEQELESVGVPAGSQAHYYHVMDSKIRSSRPLKDELGARLQATSELIKHSTSSTTDRVNGGTY